MAEDRPTEVPTVLASTSPQADRDRSANALTAAGLCCPRAAYTPRECRYDLNTGPTRRPRTLCDPIHVRPDRRVRGHVANRDVRPHHGAPHLGGFAGPRSAPHRPTLADALAADLVVFLGVRPSRSDEPCYPCRTADLARGSRLCLRARAGSRKTALLGSRSQVSPPLSERKCSVSDSDSNTVRNTGYRHFLTYHIY